jgi:hypothetical protein
MFNQIPSPRLALWRLWWWLVGKKPPWCVTPEERAVIVTPDRLHPAIQRFAASERTGRNPNHHSPAPPA